MLLPDQIWIKYIGRKSDLSMNSKGGPGNCPPAHSGELNDTPFLAYRSSYAFFLRPSDLYEEHGVYYVIIC